MDLPEKPPLLSMWGAMQRHTGRVCMERTYKEDKSPNTVALITQQNKIINVPKEISKISLWLFSIGPGFHLANTPSMKKSA